MFIRHRTEDEIKLARETVVADLRDPATDADRVKPGHEQWLVVSAICTHLGCVPGGSKSNQPRGEFGGWFCPCHGSQYRHRRPHPQRAGAAQSASCALRVPDRHQNRHRLTAASRHHGARQVCLNGRDVHVATRCAGYGQWADELGLLRLRAPRLWPRSRRGRRGGRGRGRMFDNGDLRLVVMQLLSERPRHGYEIIKALEERVGGGYSPSPGVVYPTLTLLEELGHATVTDERAGRKLYTLTPDGRRRWR